MNTRKVAFGIGVGILLMSLGGPKISYSQADEHQTGAPFNFLSWAKEKEAGDRMKWIVGELKKQVNKTPYIFSGSSKAGWDCSGLVRWQYKTGFGITLPHSADKLGHIGKRVSKPNLGDIVVMARAGSSSFYHAGVYAGQNKVLNANRFYGTTVIEPLSNYKNDQIRFIRIVKVKA
jgi:cell wall-associated NlpC family hydrolase